MNNFNNLNKKQKILIIVFVLILLGGILYYVYGRDRQELIPYDEENLIEDNNKMENNPENNLEDGNNKEETELEMESEMFSDTEIVVYVTGAVRKEGVYGLKPNSRVADAIDKAGGVNEEADISDLNLAYKLEDGIKIKIPTKKEVEEARKNASEDDKEELSNKWITNGIGSVNGNNNNVNKKYAENTNSSTSQKVNKVNINTATQEELETLPGIGPAIAQKITAYRKEKGKFSNIEQIKEVNGIGESKYTEIKEFITVK